VPLRLFSWPATLQAFYFGREPKVKVITTPSSNNAWDNQSTDVSMSFSSLFGG
jgi:hypothetical protein